MSGVPVRSNGLAALQANVQQSHAFPAGPLRFPCATDRGLRDRLGDCRTRKLGSPPLDYPTSHLQSRSKIQSPYNEAARCRTRAGADIIRSGRVFFCLRLSSHRASAPTGNRLPLPLWKASSIRRHKPSTFCRSPLPIFAATSFESGTYASAGASAAPLFLSLTRGPGHALSSGSSFLERDE